MVELSGKSEVEREIGDLRSEEVLRVQQGLKDHKHKRNANNEIRWTVTVLERGCRILAVHPHLETSCY